MADQPNTDKADKKAAKQAAKAAKAGSRSNLVPALVVAAGLVGGGVMMGRSDTGSAEASSTPTTMGSGEHMDDGSMSMGEHLDCAAEDIRSEPEMGPVVSLEPITINLKDDHYLRVGIALQFDSATSLEELTESGHANTALDSVIQVLGGRAKEEFESNRAQQQAKDEITELVRPRFECHVLEVLFTEFVTE
jgi:flagellar basal body-associated protein FliL